ncbi:putative integral membrane protein [Aspergillus pseudonomiae]|uniref:Putative integral membrane protein n=1 Tax=Aspergillus pseudonomiae TaxID=1506151 RepID=A0A5N7DDT3_9EURO|nr:putative integral membrane protein [Aspergillus pseudonomiae]KAB8259503.1 putative integral membrane protein [Aspergillus pseudonomiae]KAE8404335.1 putative integral membrane protein [Aspergillus pseudonomiae]
MASGVVIDPYALLRAAPLATSTGSLVLATSELIYYSGLVQPPTRKKSDSILAQYWRYVFPRGVSLVLALNVTTIGTSLCNIFLKNPCSRPLPVSRTTFYWAGLMGAIGHLAFVPFVAPPIQRILDNTDPEAETSKEMDIWLGIHRIRMLVADIPAWLAFVGAAMLTDL